MRRMQRFEYIAGTAAKFWTIECRGTSVTTSWGRIGTAGQTKTKDFGSVAAAQKAEERLLREKTREGYAAVPTTKRSAGKATSPLAVASHTPTGPLTAIEMWDLGRAIAGKADRKISGRLDLAWGAGQYWERPGIERSGACIPSKGGKLLVGYWTTPKTAASVAAAPGNGSNALFSVYFRAGGSSSDDWCFWGVRFNETPPIVWRVQKPIAAAGKNRRTYAGVWTPGVPHADLESSEFKIAKAGSVLAASHTLTETLHWAIGFDAKGRAVCMLCALGDADVLADVDGVSLAEPAAGDLAALHARPHRLALSANELAAIGPGAKTSERVPSVKGVLCLGNFATPAKAIKLELGDKHNRSFRLAPKTGQGPLRSPALAGVTLSNAAPVRWSVGGEFAPGAEWPQDPDRVRVGLWSPGAERTNDAFDKYSCPGATKGALSSVAPVGSKLIWIIGYDAAGKPAAIAFGDARTAVYFDRGDAVGGAAQASMRDEDEDEDEDEDDTDAPLMPATASELVAIADAIAAGPKTKKATISKRFSLSWDKTAIPTVRGKLRVGDPAGASFDLAAGADGPKQAFLFFDGKDEDAGAWGRVIVGVRLGEGKAVKWKPSMGLGVDSGRYGVWSPGYPTTSVDAGTHTAASLAAKIQQTSEGDCSFPSLLGLDAAKRPVAFLFGEAVRPEVFGARSR
jgi:predicted DNA-binding WGR domain protein